MAVDALAEKLFMLVTAGNIAWSRLSDRDRSRLQSLFETEVLAVERSGAGKKVVVKNLKALDAFVQRFYPSGLLGRSETLLPKSRAVAELQGFEEGSRNWSAYYVIAGRWQVSALCR